MFTLSHKNTRDMPWKKSSEYTMNVHITSYFYLFCYLSNLWNEKFYLMRLINMKFTLCFVFLMGFYLNFFGFFSLHFYVCNYPFNFSKTFFLIFCNEYGYLISKLIYFGNCLSFVLILIIKSKMKKLFKASSLKFNGTLNNLIFFYFFYFQNGDITV